MIDYDAFQKRCMLLGADAAGFSSTLYPQWSTLDCLVPQVGPGLQLGSFNMKTTVVRSLSSAAARTVVAAHAAPDLRAMRRIGPPARGVACCARICIDR